MDEPGGAPPGAAPSTVRALLRTVLSFLETRGRIAAGEFEEQVLRANEILVWTLVAVGFFGLAVLLASTCIVLLFWDTYRVLAAGLLAGIYLIAGGVCLVVVRARLAQRPPLLSATLAELVKDRERLDHR